MIPTLVDIHERAAALNKLRAEGKPARIENDPWKPKYPSCCTGTHGPAPQPRQELGDHVEQALTKVGITSERISEWFGVKCNCAMRKAKLNQLSIWARQVLSSDNSDVPDLP